MASDHPPLQADVNPAWRIGIVASMWHKDVVDSLVDAAVHTLTGAGIPSGNITRHDAAGSFEIPLIGAALAKHKQVDALIALGVIVRGETHHASLIAEQVARGVMDVQLTENIPFVFEVLSVDDIAHAKQRAGSTVNRGADAARAALYSLAKLASIRS